MFANLEEQTIEYFQKYFRENNTGKTEENSPIADLPFDVSKDLDQFSRIFISFEFDNFRIIHCLEKSYPSFDYVIYGELPDGDKKLLFTCSKHNQFCKCFNSCSIHFGLFELFLCDSILFQMDYKRNNKTFYTQGVNIKKGCKPLSCHLCSMFCCCCDCTPSIMNLRENTDPNNPDLDVGKIKGVTYGRESYLGNRDNVVSYISEIKGPSIRIKPSCSKRCCCCCCCCCDCSDKVIDIEDGNGSIIGNLFIPKGCNSEKVKDLSCHLPRKYYEINITANITSEQKFQIIADVIHCSILNYD